MRDERTACKETLMRVSEVSSSQPGRLWASDSVLMAGGGFDCHACGEGATGSWWEEVRAAAGHRTAPTTKNYLVYNGNSAKGKKCCHK